MDELDQYDYELPKELIAQRPLPQRTDARLLLVDRRRQACNHAHIRDLPHCLRPGDCLVVNDTQVVPARLVGRRQATGGRWQGLFLDCDPHGNWHLLSRTRGKLQVGEWIEVESLEGQDRLRMELIAKLDDASWVARPATTEATAAGSPWGLLERFGRVPLPQYIRGGEMEEQDREHYQTLFAQRPGAIAAPTAGLHFTASLRDQLQAAQIVVVPLTLHVGVGTFRPITAARLQDHPMHVEHGSLSADAAAKLVECRARGGRVIAVGTTSVRVLETAARGGTLQAWEGSTDLFIRPPFEFHAIDGLLTNFHLPRSTLLVLVRTFGGDALIRQAYQMAIDERYRFYSYGDAMLIT